MLTQHYVFVYANIHKVFSLHALLHSFKRAKVPVRKIFILLLENYARKIIVKKKSIKMFLSITILLSTSESYRAN